MTLRNLSSIFISRCLRRAVTKSIYSSKFCDRININAEDGCDGEELKVVESRVSGNLLVSDNFISEEEEAMLFEEVRALLEKRSYQHEHWDDVSRTAVMTYMHV